MPAIKNIHHFPQILKLTNIAVIHAKPLSIIFANLRLMFHLLSKQIIIQPMIAQYVVVQICSQKEYLKMLHKSVLLYIYVKLLTQSMFINI